MNDGGIPNIVMSQIFLPIIYHYFTSEFKTIFEEISFKWIYISKAPKSSFKFFNESIMNEDLYRWFCEMYNYIDKEKDNIHYGHPEIMLASIYLQGTTGHAINILDSQDDVYVIDDDTVMKPLKDYLNDLGEKFVRLVISDFDKDFADRLPRTGFKQEARIHKISITNWKHEDDAKYFIELQRDHPLDSQIATYEFGNESGMTGGSPLSFVLVGMFVEALPRHITVLIWIINALLITLILIIVILKIIGAKNNEKIQKIQSRIQKLGMKIHKDVSMNGSSIMMKDIENETEKQVESVAETPVLVKKSLLKATRLFNLI
jgi:hypothetical protein